MKKVIYLLAFVSVIFTGCNPLEDINKEIDAIPDAPNIGAFEYTLTDDDYDAFDLGFGSFNSEQQAKDSIPQLLSELYPLYGQGSSVLTSYNLYIGSAEGVSDYTGSDVYEFSNADYAATGSDAFGFYPDVNPTEQIPAVLDAQIPAPIEGQLVLAKYDQYYEVPEIGLAPVYNAEFPVDYDSFELISVSGPDELGWTLGASNVQGSGFSGGAVATEEWLVSPLINLTGQTDLKLQITQEIDFLGDDGLIDVMISTDHITGDDIMYATWTAFAFDKTIYGDMTASDDFDFSAYDGQTIHIGLKYSSTDADSPRWRVESLAIKTLGVSGDTDAKGEYFMYDGGSWEASEGVDYMSSSDYDSMGEESGQPGRFNNFSSSTPADNYIPTFLTIKYPFAQAEDQIFVVYNYFSGGLSTRGQSYMFINGVWTPHESTIESSLQFGYNDGVWVPDNTIRYTIAQPDFDYIDANYGETVGYVDAVGSMANYGNFDRRPSSVAYWSDEMLLTVISDLLTNVIAPGAENEQKYVVSFDIYDGSNSVEELSLIKTDGSWIVNED